MYSAWPPGASSGGTAGAAAAPPNTGAIVIGPPDNTGEGTQSGVPCGVGEGAAAAGTPASAGAVAGVGTPATSGTCDGRTYVAEAGAGLNTSAGAPMAGRGGSVVDKPSMGRGVTGTGALPADGDVAAAPGHVGADKASMGRAAAELTWEPAELRTTRRLCCTRRAFCDLGPEDVCPQSKLQRG